MDFKAAFDILSRREPTPYTPAPGTSTDATSTAAVPVPVPVEQPILIGGEAATAALQATLQALDTLELLNLVTALQGERVETYASYDASLGVLIEQQRLEEYPNLVAETTSVFAVLSARIRSIRDILLARGGAVEGEAAAAITLLQSAEKDKLTLVAAAHLDKLGRGGAVAGVLGGMTLLAEGEGGYTSKRLLEVEAAIRGHVESIQAAKCDAMEG